MVALQISEWSITQMEDSLAMRSTQTHIPWRIYYITMYSHMIQEKGRNQWEDQLKWGTLKF